MPWILSFFLVSFCYACSSESVGDTNPDRGSEDGTLDASVDEDCDASSEAEQCVATEENEAGGVNEADGGPADPEQQPGDSSDEPDNNGSEAVPIGNPSIVDDPQGVWVGAFACISVGASALFPCGDLSAPCDLQGATTCFVETTVPCALSGASGGVEATAYNCE